MKRQTGFTLVELVIVIAVLGILAGLAIPYFMEAREEAAKKECLANRTQIMRMFYAQQASNYNGTLVGFLAEVVKEPNDNKYFNFVPKCADNGTYSVSNEKVVCSIAEHNEANVSDDASVIDNITNDFQEFLDKYGAMTDQQLKDLGWWPTYASGALVKTNDGFREAYYKEKAYYVIEMLKKKNLLEVSEGANVVNIGDDIVPALIQKSDGTSIYITRDLAAYIDRLEKYKFDEILYVVGNEQTLHFEQLKRVLSKMGYDSNKLKHISFGLMLQNGKKMSTRGGTGLNLQDLLDSSISLANKYIEEKNPTLKDKEEVSKKIGVGAVIFNDLKNYRVNDIDFNLEETLSFTGNTGPYIQYTNARINSLLEHYKENDINYDEIDINDTIWNVIFDLYEFPEVVVKSKDNYDPSEIAKYLLNLSSDFNKMYANVKIIDDNNNKTNFNLALSKCVGVVLTEGMRLLGIKMPNKM